MQKITKLLCALLLLFSVGMQAQAVVTVNKYINPYTGSDSNSGDSWEEAWKTLDKAMLAVSKLEAANTGMWDYQLHITQGYFVATKTLNNNGWGDHPTHATTDHRNNSMILLRQGTKLTIDGGYSLNPSVARREGSQPHKYPTLIYKTDVPKSSFVRLINGNGGGIALKNLTFTDIRGGADDEGSLITVDGATSGHVAEDKTVELDNVIIHNWQGNIGAIYVKGAINTKVDIKKVMVEQTLKKNYGMFFGTNYQAVGTKVDVNKSTFRNTNVGSTDAAIFRMYVAKSRETSANNYSYLNIDSSEFYNNYRGSSVEQTAAVVKAVGLKDFTVKNSKLSNNRGGYGGVFWLQACQNITSEGNIYQNNFSGHSGGVYFIVQDYDKETTTASFKKDKFYKNFSGVAAGAGRGGAIFIAGDVTMTSILNPKVDLIIDESEFKDNFVHNIHGGAIATRTSGNTKISNSIFCNNSCSFGGASTGSGGAAAFLGSGNVEITKTTFQENSARNGGAGSALGGALFLEKNATITDSFFYSNYANTRGGAIYIVNTTGSRYTLTASNNVFYNNNGTSGGAIDASGGANVILENNIFELNSARNETGGAVRIADLTSEKFIIRNNKFYSNKSVTHGGAIHLYARNGYIENNQFYKNQVTNGIGGAISLPDTGSFWYRLRIKDNQFFHNKASKEGGALYVSHSVAPGYKSNYLEDEDNTTGINVINSDFYYNDSPKGGAIYVQRGTTFHGVEINAIHGSKFYGNSANDLESSGPAANVGKITNSYLQNTPTSYDARFAVDETNEQSDENTISTADYIEYATVYAVQDGERPWTTKYRFCKEVQIGEAPLSPTIQARWGVSKKDNPGEYDEYVEGVQTESCEIKNVFLKFSAETNREYEYFVGDQIYKYSLPEPAPELTFTFYAQVSDWKNGTGATLMGPFTIKAPPSATFEKDPNDGTPRRLYNDYYLDITKYIEPHRTYTFYITKVKGDNLENEFKEKQIITTIHTLDKSEECVQCFFSANTTGGQGIPTIHGITTLTKAGGQGNWPMARIGAWTALESSNKGFVITRLSTEQLTNITNPQEGMMVYDTTENCLKIYNGTSWKCLSNQYCE